MKKTSRKSCSLDFCPMGFHLILNDGVPKERALEILTRHGLVCTDLVSEKHVDCSDLIPVELAQNGVDVPTLCSELLQIGTIEPAASHQLSQPVSEQTEEN